MDSKSFIGSSVSPTGFLSASHFRVPSIKKGISRPDQERDLKRGHINLHFQLEHVYSQVQQ